MGVSFWQIIFVLAYVFVVVTPVARILARLGYSRAWAALAFVPLLNIVGLWVLAGAAWPRVACGQPPEAVQN